MTVNLTTLEGTPVFTGTAKFGSASLAGTGSLVGVGADDFISSNKTTGGTMQNATIDAWVKTTATSIRVAVSHSGWYWLGMNALGKATASIGNTAPVTLTSTTTINTGAYFHLSLVFGPDGSSQLFVNGVEESYSGTPKVTEAVANSSFSVGGLSSNAIYDWGGSGSGNVDEVRLSSVPRFQTSFTAPTAEYTWDFDTMELWHFNGNGTAHSTTSLAMNNANFQYSPYNWNVTSVRAKTINPGAYMHALIQGTSIEGFTLRFDMTGLSTPIPQIKYRVDQGGWRQADLADMVVLRFTPSSNNWNTHYIEVIVKATNITGDRWTTQSTGVALTAIEVKGGTSIASRALERRSQNVAVFGDSITEGVRTLGIAATLDTDENDSTIAWSYLLRDFLGAEVGVIGFGGQGLDNTGVGNVPIFGSSWNFLWSGQARTWTPTPDAVVICQGTNDSTNTTTTWTSILNAMLTALPNVPIIVIRPFEGDLVQAGYMVAGIAATTAPYRITYVDTAGWFATTDDTGDDDLHPPGYWHLTRIAPRAAAAIKTKLKPTNIWLKTSGGYKALGSTLKG